MQLNVEVVLLYDSFPYAFEIWDLLGPTHPEYGDIEVIEGYKDRKLAFGTVASHLRNRGTEDLRIEFSGGCIEHGDIFDLQLGRLDLMQLVRDRDDAERWLEKLLKDERFVH